MEASYPVDRDTAIKSSKRWLTAKSKDDECGQLWRIHNDLYDLSDFAADHPGGQSWIEMTRGQDITEAVETMHWKGLPKSLLARYRVAPAGAPRRYRYTFHADGFYQSLKRRAKKVLLENSVGEEWKSKLIQDCLTASFLITFLILCHFPTTPLALIAGLLLGLSSSCAHNWFHQGDKKAWRRFYFDLSCLSHQEWRVSHAISHHLHTNSLTDVEVTAVEPLLSFLPESKHLLQTQFAVPLLQIFSWIGVPGQLFLRIFLILSGEQSLLLENLLPILQYLLLLNNCSPVQAFWLWFLCHGAAGYWLIITSVTTTHHHPSLWHAGDEPRQNTDWGLHQLDTVRDLDKRSLVLVLTTFGHHLLHHLFPSLDHSRLESLYPALWETCEEFGESYPFQTLKSMVGGCHEQLAREKPRSYGGA